MEAAVKAKREGNNLRFNLKEDNVKQKITSKGAAALSQEPCRITKTAIFLFFDRSSILLLSHQLFSSL